MEFIKNNWFKILLVLFGIYLITLFIGSDSPSTSDYDDFNYICSYDAYNCSDFSSHREAQSVFDYCSNDIHRLDRDNDGIACESLR